MLGRALRRRVQALPRVFAEESQRDVVGRASPRLDRQQLRRHARDVRGDRDESLRAHAGRQQRLVRVTEGRLGDREGRLLAQGAGEAARVRARAGAGASRPEAGARDRSAGSFSAGSIETGVLAVRLVDGDVGEPVEDLRAAVLRLAAAQQLRALVDERRAHVAGDEVGVVEHRLQERDVGGHAADAELGERAPRAHDGRARSPGRGR